MVNKPTRRRPLPYAAAALLGRCEENCLTAIKTLTAVLDAPMTSDERYRLIGKALHNIHEAEDALREITIEKRDGETYGLSD